MHSIEQHSLAHLPLLAQHLLPHQHVPCERTFLYLCLPPLSYDTVGMTHTPPAFLASMTVAFAAVQVQSCAYRYA